MNILSMNKESILRMDPGSITRMLTKEELLHICSVLDCWWIYDYDAADAGRLGMHAILKSLNHSDGFINLKTALEYDTILEIFARQQYIIYDEMRTLRYINKPVWLCGIPDAATGLGKRLSELIGSKYLELKKSDKKILIEREMGSQVRSSDTVLIVEDLCSFGTGVSEAIIAIKKAIPGVQIFPMILYIFNRGKLTQVYVDGIGSFEIMPLASHKIKTWERVEGQDFSEWCELCRMGSGQIQPKKSHMHWHNLVTSQSLLAT